jgi:hypothetical protein
VQLTDDTILAQQLELQAEADAVVADLGLMPLLGRLGRPVRTGSSALGLMVDRDIDITTLCPELDPNASFLASRPLIAHPRVRELLFRNDTGRWNTDPDYPDGLYWRVGYVADDGTPWNLDLWFLREGTTQFDLQHIASLPDRLTNEHRIAILRIKRALAEDRPPEPIASFEIYAAVLDGGVTSVEGFLGWRTDRGA